MDINRRNIHSRCDPFKQDTLTDIRNSACDVPYELAIAERPHIRNVRGPLTAHPFVDVEMLRTPVDGFLFNIKEFLNKESYQVDTLNFKTVKYQNYVPDGFFRDDYYYSVSCVAVNASGISEKSNVYPVNLLRDTAKKSYQKIICGGVIICDVPILCG